MFTRKTISSIPRRRLYFFKYMTMFFLGVSAVILATQAFEIDTSLNNAVQYISQIILTNDGTNTASTAIELDGSNGNAYFSGQVGIGTNTPSQALEINGNVSLTTGGRMGATTNQVYMAKNGNAGIGTAIPTEKFQVGTYARIGQHNEPLLGTGGSFLRIFGNDPTDYGLDVGGGGFDPVMTFNSASKTYAAGELPDYSPNIQLNYHWLNSTLGGGSFNENWKIVGNQTLSFRHSDGTVMPSKLMSIDQVGNAAFYNSAGNFEFINGKLRLGTTNSSNKFNIDGNIRFVNSGYLAASSSVASGANANQLFLGLNGKVGINTVNTGAANLEVNYLFKLTPYNYYAPTCNAAARGTMYFSPGQADGKDHVCVCILDSTPNPDVYVRRTMDNVSVDCQ
ncbi:MAG: hypothetical protein NTX91_04320 [candidate division SR1 bacterium]|nr:hypothetical protein [candidate division SR1 bacterium]